MEGSTGATSSGCCDVSPATGTAGSLQPVLGRTGLKCVTAEMCLTDPLRVCRLSVGVDCEVSVTSESDNDTAVRYTTAAPSLGSLESPGLDGRRRGGADSGRAGGGGEGGRAGGRAVEDNRSEGVGNARVCSGWLSRDQQNLGLSVVGAVETCLLTCVCPVGC